jgi:hypothetical protein
MMERVTDSLEGRLGLWSRVFFAIHVRTCWHCRQYLEKLRATIQALGYVAQPEPPSAAVMDRLLEQFRRRGEGERHEPA